MSEKSQQKRPHVRPVLRKSRPNSWPILSLDVFRPYRLLTGGSEGENHHLVASHREQGPVFSFGMGPEQQMANLLGEARIFVGQATGEGHRKQPLDRLGIRLVP